MDNPVVRLTWQMSPRNKFAAYMDRAMRLRGHAMGSLHRSGDRVGGVAHADLRDRLGEVDVDGVVEAAASRAGFSFNRERYDNVYQAGHRSAARHAPAWYAGARKSDNSTGLLWNASSAQLGNYPGQVQR